MIFPHWECLQPWPGPAGLKCPGACPSQSSPGTPPGLPHLPAATTAQHRLVGAQGTATAPRSLVSQSGVEAYGDEQALLQQLPGADRVLALGLTEAMVRFAARYEYAITVEDVLARRYRLLFLDSSLAAQVAPQVAEILREERATDPQLETFLSLCQQYQLA